MPLAQSGSWGWYFVLEEGRDNFGGKIVSGELELRAYRPTAAGALIGNLQTAFSLYCADYESHR